MLGAVRESQHGHACSTGMNHSIIPAIVLVVAAVLFSADTGPPAIRQRHFVREIALPGQRAS